MAGRADECPRTGQPYAGWAAELLGLLRPAGRDPRRVVTWLGRTVGAEVCLQDAHGHPLAGEPVSPDAAVLAEVAAGRISAAALQDGTRHLRIVGIRHPEQGPAAAAVLVLARADPFDRRAAEIVTHTAGVLELLLRERQVAQAGRRLRRATADLRLAILQLLMVEDTVSARRVAAGLWPGLLRADTARVYVAEGPAVGRDALAEEFRRATEGRALVVRCPARDGHVIVVSFAPDMGERLRSLAGGRPDVCLGGSLRQHLARTATAYGQAVSALAVARFRPERTAYYAERLRPAGLVDPSALRVWAAGVLRPLDTLPHHTRAELLATTRLGLEFTAVDAARILGVSRNTVRARTERVEALLETDLSGLTARAVTHLALTTEATREPYGPGGAEPRPAAGVRLGDLLASPALSAWARDLLGRLDGDGRDLRGTLCAWLAAGANAERAARRRGLHAQTVREHVRAAEPVLARRLLAPGTDLYEVVLAHLATGDLPAPARGGANPGQPDPAVHG